MACASASRSRRTTSGNRPWLARKLAAICAAYRVARIARDKLLDIKPDFSPHAALAAWSPLNPEALRPLFKTWIEGLRKAGLDIPDEPVVDD